MLGSGLHALDVPVHLGELGVRYRQAVPTFSAPAWSMIGPVNGWRVPAMISALTVSAAAATSGGTFGSVGRHADHALLEAVPDVLRLPGAVEHRLGAVDVVGPPVVDDRGQLAPWARRRHVGGLAEAVACRVPRPPAAAPALSVCWAMMSAPWSISVLAASRFLARIVPGVDPDHLGLDVRVDLLRRQREGVDAHHHLGDRERADIADHAGLASSCRRWCRSPPGPRRSGRCRSRRWARPCSRWRARTSRSGTAWPP